MRNWIATKLREMADRIDGNTTFIASVGSVCTAPGGGGQVMTLEALESLASQQKTISAIL